MSAIGSFLHLNWGNINWIEYFSIYHQIEHDSLGRCSQYYVTTKSLKTDDDLRINGIWPDVVIGLLPIASY